MSGTKQSRTNPLQAMWRTPKTPASEVDEHIDLCNDLLERVDASWAERANAAAAGGGMKTSRRSRCGQHRPPKGRHQPEEAGKESMKDAFERKLEAVASTKRRVKGRREELMVDFQERRCRRQSEQLVVEFPSANARAYRAHRSFDASIPPLVKESRKTRLTNDISERTVDTEVSFEEVTEDRNSRFKETTKKKTKKQQVLGDFTDKFDWSESSIVWGDEECSSDEESSSARDPNGVNFARSTKFRRSSDQRRSILSSRSGSRRSREPSCSRSLMSADLSFRSVESSGSNNPLWQSFSTLNVSFKKLEP